jgi:hypothetical protein
MPVLRKHRAEILGGSCVRTATWYGDFDTVAAEDDETMLSRRERDLIYEHAYVPEHLPDYVQSVSGAEPFLHEGHVCFVQSGHLVFVGYPVLDDGVSTAEAYESACSRFRPATVAVIGRNIWVAGSAVEPQPNDSYFRLDLPLAALKPDLAYMVRRATREVQVCEGIFGEEHRQLVEFFIGQRVLSQAYCDIFRRLPSYLALSSTGRLLEARRGDELAAFNIVDMGSAKYAFYLFNFRSLTPKVPGASDLLFYEMARLAQAEGKGALNLGLGISDGVRRFKEKWGAVPFLPYASALIKRKQQGPLGLISRFQRFLLPH